MKLTYQYLFILLLLVNACAPARFVKPLEEKQTAIGANFGGELIGFSGATIPLPLTSLYAGYGLQHNLTVFGSIHTTALAFGVIQTDIGVVKSFSTPSRWKPGISLTPAINFMTDLFENNSKFYPQLDINAYWHYKQSKNFIYAGLSNWFEPAYKRALGEKQQHHWIPSIQAGHTFVKTKMDYTIELKWVAPNLNNENIVVEYKTPGNRGAIGVYLSATRIF